MTVKRKSQQKKSCNHTRNKSRKEKYFERTRFARPPLIIFNAHSALKFVIRILINLKATGFFISQQFLSSSYNRIFACFIGRASANISANRIGEYENRIRLYLFDCSVNVACVMCTFNIKVDKTDIAYNPCRRILGLDALNLFCCCAILATVWQHLQSVAS